MANERTVRFSGWWGGILAKLRKPGWIATLLLPVLWFVLRAFADDLTVKVVSAVGKFLGGVLSGIVSGAVGITVVVFLALLGLLVFRAYWETRPSREKSMESLTRALETQQGDRGETAHGR